MLTLQPAPRPQRHVRPRLGLALAGGGPLGAFYEIGALQALAESIEGLDLTRLDAYVGVSSGAMVAAGLANGISTADMGVVFIDNAAAEYPMSPGLFLQPAFHEYLSRARGAPGLLSAIVRQYLNAPTSGAWAAAIEPLGRLVSTGLFDNRPFERFIAHIFSTHGRSNDFRTLKRKLYVIATDLDGGTEARFGAPDRNHVPISKAIQASTALPGLYPSVEIDGHTYVDGALLRTMHASVALEQGASLVFCVNPLVAFDAYAHGTRSHDLRRGGLPRVMNQTFRALIQSRMQVGMSAYRGRFPTSDMLLFEPDRSDEEMFFVNVFKYAGRRNLSEHSYQRTRADLARHARALAPLLARHGLKLRREVLNDRTRTFRAAMASRQLDFGPVSSRLTAALDRLEATL